MPNGQNYRQKRINYALAATLLMSGMTLEQAAVEVGAKNSEVLRVGLAKRGVTCGKARALQQATAAMAGPTPGMVATVTARLATHASTIVNEASRKLRQSLATATEQSAAVLEAKPPKNVKEVIQRAGTLKSLVESGDKLHGWSAQASAPQWNVTVLDRGEVARPACGVDATTGSMPAQVAESVTPQAQQVIDVDTVA